MIDVLFTIAFLLIIIGWFGSPWIKPAVIAAFGWVRSKFAWGMRVLMWSAPNAQATGALFTFTGVEIGNSFIGRVTKQDVKVDFPVETPRIVRP